MKAIFSRLRGARGDRCGRCGHGPGGVAVRPAVNTRPTTPRSGSRFVGISPSSLRSRFVSRPMVDPVRFRSVFQRNWSASVDRRQASRWTSSPDGSNIGGDRAGLSPCRPACTADLQELLPLLPSAFGSRACTRVRPRLGSMFQTAPWPLPFVISRWRPSAERSSIALRLPPESRPPGRPWQCPRAKRRACRRGRGSGRRD